MLTLWAGELKFIHTAIKRIFLVNKRSPWFIIPEVCLWFTWPAGGIEWAGTTRQPGPVYRRPFHEKTSEGYVFRTYR